jgi:RNA polymerase sigma-32 factor
VLIVERINMSLPVLSDTLGIYLAEINRFPILTREEEHRVALRYYEKKDLDAAHKLVTSNLRFVVKIALEYRNYGCSLKDLIQEGNLGLMTAVKKFNPHKGTRLITYAVWWIRSFIQEFILKTKGFVKRNSKALKRHLFYRDKAEASLPDAEKVRPLPPALNQAPTDLSLDTPIGEEETTHLDTLRDLNPGQEEAIADAQERAIVKNKVNRALALLNEKERFIIEKRIMAEEPLSLRFIGERLGLSRERIRQIESAALKKLQKILPGKAPSQLSLTAGN